MKVFPAADLFPMLPDDELQQLAADIKTNGQRDPIVVAMIDGVEMLVDGRNRLAACKLADVEPAVRRLNGEDPTAFVVSVNINRRHMLKSQRAMAVAMIYPTPEKGGRGRKATKFVEFSPQLLSYARTVFAHTPELAKLVLAGDMPLQDAYERASALKAEGESEGAKLNRLRNNAPDLAELVDTGKLPVAEATAAHDQREKDAALAKQNQNEVAYRLSESAYRGCAAWANPDFVASVEKDLAEEPAFRRQFIERVRCQDIDAVMLGAKHLTAVLKALAKGETQ